MTKEKLIIEHKDSLVFRTIGKEYLFLFENYSASSTKNLMKQLAKEYEHKIKELEKTIKDLEKTNKGDLRIIIDQETLKPSNF